MRKQYLLIILLFVVSLEADRKFSFSHEFNKEITLNNQHTDDVEIALLKKEPFIAISLGMNCFPALQLREHGIRVRSFPFDWDITPFSALYAILENDFRGFIDLKNLAINQKENTVFNKHYQFKLNHDFDIKDWYDGSEGLTPHNKTGVLKYQKVVAYYQRRIARFYKVFELGVPIYLFRRIITAEQAKKLNRLLRSKFPHTDFKLICIQDEGWEAPSVWKKIPSNIIYYRLSHPIGHSDKKPKNELMTNVLRSLGLIR